MSDKEVVEAPPVVEEPVEEPPVEAPVKPKRRPMTEERKAQMLENLRKGRETAKKNRELKKQGVEPPPKKPKAKKMEIKEDIVNTQVQAELNTDLSNVSIMNSIESLKKEIADLKKMPKTDFQSEEIKALKEELKELKSSNKKQKEALKEPVKELVADKPPISKPINIPQPPAAISTYIPSVWSQFK